MDCPICGAAPTERFLAKYVTALKCSKCGHIFAENPAVDQGVQQLPDPQQMLETYAKRDHNLIAYWRKQGFIKNHTSLLDIGAGSGHILRCIRKEMPEVKIDCIEGDQDASKYLQLQGFRVFPKLSDLAQDYYDSIIMIEVLEHINDPITFLKNCKTLLKPQGCIFFTTPCGETRSGNRALKAYDTPEHVQFWMESSFSICCREAGFTYEQIAPGIMYPTKNIAERVLKDFARTIRDSIVGRSHLVGYLRPC